MTGMLANTTTGGEPQAMITSAPGQLAILLAVLAVIMWASAHPVLGRIFKVIPSLVFCYFIPTALTTLGVLPHESHLYDWVKGTILPTALLLLILALDVPGLLRLGPKALIMLLAGTTGVVIGGPISLWLMSSWLPEDIWRGMAALCGSWIGGGANFIALGQIAEASDAMIAMMIIPDVFCANIWMGILLYLAGRQHAVDNWMGARTEAIRDLERRMTDFHERVNRIPTLADLLVILALGFVGSWLSVRAGYAIDGWLRELAETHEVGAARVLRNILSASTWKYILVTTLGVVLSFTGARNLEGAGASKLGSVMIYLLVACIGATANFATILESPALIVMGLIWISIHVAVLVGVGILIRAPIFFVAIGSQANIGGAASAPIVAAAFHPSLAPVGVLLAVAGYVLGTYAGIVCMNLLRWVSP